MTYRLLFDENLSPELVELAIAAGYVNSTCVRDRGLRAAKDWELMDVIIQGDYTSWQTGLYLYICSNQRSVVDGLPNTQLSQKHPPVPNE
jgi:hypothetical protein